MFERYIEKRLTLSESYMRYLTGFETYKLNEATTKATTKKAATKNTSTTSVNKGTSKKTTDKKKTETKTAPKTIEEVKTEYANLLTNIQKQAKVPVITTALSKQKLDAVKFLQAFLIVKGKSVKADGAYGELSKKAMQEYQSSVSLTADGAVGLKTWQNILKEFSQDASNYTTIKVDATKTTDRANALTNGSIAKIADTYSKILSTIKEKKEVPLLSIKMKSQKLEEVKFVQEYLNFVKYDVGTADGLFGQKTSDAVMKLQTKNNVKADGIIGLKSWAIILKDFGITSLDGYKITKNGTAVTAKTKSGLSEIKAKYINILNESQREKKLPLLTTSVGKIKSDYVSLVQEYLTYKKIKTGVDGLYGEGTKTSVSKWQQSVKLNADGAIGLKSWALIMKDFNLSIDDFVTFTLVDKSKQETPKAPAAAVNTNTAADESFYNLSKEDEDAFNKTEYKTSDGSMTGEKLATTNYMKSGDIGDVIKMNPDSKPLTLLFKKDFVLLGNISPMKYVVQYPAVKEDVTNPILKLGQPRLIGELIYYGLRGLGVDKGIDNALVIKRVIKQLSTWGDAKKRSIESWFNKAAQSGDIEKYRDTNTYPLRRWLYEEFKNDDPYKWMNHITEDSYHQKLNKRIPANAPDDEELYPVGKGSAD